MSKSILNKTKFMLQIPTCIYLLFSCNHQKIPNGLFKGKIGECTYCIDFRDDFSVLLEKYNTIHANLLVRKVGSYEMISEKFFGIWKSYENYIEVKIISDKDSVFYFYFDRNDLIEKNSKERFIKKIIN